MPSSFQKPRNGAPSEPWLPGDIPRDILCDGARVAALLDIRQMIGPRSEPQVGETEPRELGGCGGLGLGLGQYKWLVI